MFAENEPEDQQKLLRCHDPTASAAILENTADMMCALRDMLTEGEKIRPEDIEFMRPDPMHKIRRFGRYSLHPNRVPESWINDVLFGQAVRSEDETR